MGAIAGALAGGVGSAVGGKLLDKVFNRGRSKRAEKVEKDILQFRPRGFSSNDLTARFNPATGLFEIQTSDGFKAGTKGLSGSFADRASRLESQLNSLPGAPQTSDAAITSLRSRGRAAIGNLRDNLARRRLSGSSFAADAISRAEAEFGEREGLLKSQLEQQDFQNQLTLSQQRIGLIDEITRANAGKFQSMIQAMGLPANMAGPLLSSIMGTSASNAQIQAQLAGNTGAGIDRFFGPAIDEIGKATSGFVSKKIGNIFK